MLNSFEAFILKWRFGLDNEEPITLQETADQRNLSRERTRQLQEKAISRIKRVSVSA
ncbi:sigma factor-like helix-turn-helix DNA-binding protein [Pajaroellobacter abortibovis]|uniref:sigma factor-like helix-turn-helix DNA-binding protein n=1 Tax=Pajaroellobacter abortibovis TaxID=1882918 RepID=UPI003B8377FE